MKTTADVFTPGVAEPQRLDGRWPWIRRPLLRAGISLALIAWLLYRIDWNETWMVFRRAQPWFLLLAALMLFLERMLAVWKWWLLIRARRLPVGYWSLFGINYAGSFLGMFIPSSVSADVVRGFSLARASADPPAAAASIVVDRSADLISLFLVTALALGFAPRNAEIPVKILAGGLAVLLIAVAGAVTVIMQRGTTQRLEQCLRRVLRNRRLADPAVAWLHACLIFRETPGWMTLNLAVSCVVQGMRILGFFVLACAFLVVPPPLLPFFLFYPLVIMAIMLPVSLGGIGMRENAFVALFSAAGFMTVSDAFAVSFTMTVLVAITSLPGAAFYFRGVQTPREPTDATKRQGASRPWNGNTVLRIF